MRTYYYVRKWIIVFCGNCGAELTAQTNFCPHCGAPPSDDLHIALPAQ